MSDPGVPIGVFLGVSSNKTVAESLGIEFRNTSVFMVSEKTNWEKETHNQFSNIFFLHAVSLRLYYINIRDGCEQALPLVDGKGETNHVDQQNAGQWRPSG